MYKLWNIRKKQWATEDEYAITFLRNDGHLITFDDFVVGKICDDVYRVFHYDIPQTTGTSYGGDKAWELLMDAEGKAVCTEDAQGVKST